MKGRWAAAAMALMATACATAATMDQRPPSLERALRGLEAEESCAEYWASSQASAGVDVIERCPAVFPKVLIDAGVRGACRSIFDVTPDGRVIGLETRCAAEPDYGTLRPDFDYGTARYKDAWLALAESLFAASVDRSFDRYRIKVGNPDLAALESGFTTITHFAIDGGREDPSLVPPLFERAGGAAPSPTRP